MTHRIVTDEEFEAAVQKMWKDLRRAEKAGELTPDQVKILENRYRGLYGDELQPD